MNAEIAIFALSNDLSDTPRASSDDQLLEIWLHGRSSHTQRAYRADTERFRSEVDKTSAASHPRRFAEVRRYAEESGSRQPVPHALRRQISAGLRTPHRIFTSRRGTRSSLAWDSRPSCRAHFAGDLLASDFGSGVQCSQSDYSHASRQRTVRA